MNNENSKNYYFSQSNSYIICKINYLNDLKQKMEALMLDTLEFRSKIQLYIDKANSEYQKLIKIINDYIDWLDSLKNNMNEISNSKEVNKSKSKIYYDDMNSQYRRYYEFTKYLVDNNYIKTIENSIQNINDTINDEANLIFDPPNINSFNNINNNIINLSFSSNNSQNNSSSKTNEENTISFNDLVRNHINELENFYSEEGSLMFTCSYCKFGEAISYCPTL